MPMRRLPTRACWRSACPTLGVCYGLHFIVHHLGGKVRSAPKREYGHAEVTIEDSGLAVVCRAAADDAGVDEPWR